MSITAEEKQELANRIAQGVRVVSSSVAQLHLSSPDPAASPYRDETGIISVLRDHGEKNWKFANIEGALLLTVNPQGVSHFRLYDLYDYRLSFQHELYENLDYVKLSNQFHAFEMENCVCGFSFASQQVAEKFYLRVQSVIPRSKKLLPHGKTAKAPSDKMMKRTFSDQKIIPDPYSKPPAGPTPPAGPLPPVGPTPPSSALPPNGPTPPAGALPPSGPSDRMMKRTFSDQKNIPDPYRKTPAGPTPPADPAPPKSQRTTRNKNKAKLGFLPKNPIMKSKKKRGTQNQKTNPEKTKNIFLGNGMLDPNQVPPEWKKILKKAGIKKKDLKNPEMFTIIKDTLAEHNIALNPPDEMDYDDERLKKYYTAEQLAQWKQYQVEMRVFEADRSRFDKEMKEYKSQKIQQEKLQQLMLREGPRLAAMTEASGKTGAERLSMSVQKFQGKIMNAPLPPIPGKRGKKYPRMSVARPVPPALPVVPERAKKKTSLVLKPNFLTDIKQNNHALKHVSVLPTIKNMEEVQTEGIMETLRQKMQEMRDQMNGSETEDDGSEFSDFVDEKELQQTPNSG